MRAIWLGIKWSLIVCIVIFLVINFWNLYARNVLKQDYPTMFGVGTGVVVSNSMQPTFSKGSYLIFQKQNSYEVNDVIVYKAENEFIVHRIIAIDADGNYITKGDNPTNSIDPPVNPSAVQGRCVVVMHDVGYVVEFLHTLAGYICIAVLAMFLLFIDPIINACKRPKETQLEEPKA